MEWQKALHRTSQNGREAPYDEPDRKDQSASGLSKYEHEAIGEGNECLPTESVTEDAKAELQGDRIDPDCGDLQCDVRRSVHTQ